MRRKRIRISRARCRLLAGVLAVLVAAGGALAQGTAAIASEGAGDEDLAAFERAKESAQLFGSPVAGLPKGLCLENRGSGSATLWDARRNGAPLPVGPRNSRRAFGAPARGQGLFRICPIYNTGLDE